MNKTININLAGLFFHIDEDAYLKLQHYLNAVKASFANTSGAEEINADIEARIAELFSERMKSERQVIGIREVEEIIGIMGQPEDYMVDEELFEDTSAEDSSRIQPRQLFRDTDNAYAGGVSSGMGHYFGIDAIWLRILWVVLTLGSSGAFLLIYLAFWIFVPEAKTTAQKLAMRGEPVNISNIERKIREGFDDVSQRVKNVDYEKYGYRAKAGAGKAATSIGSILQVIMQIIVKLVGILLLLIAGSALIALFLTHFTVGTFGIIETPWSDYFEVLTMDSNWLWILSLLSFLTLGIPLFFLFILGLKILVNNLRSIGRTAKMVLLGLWIISFLGIIFFGIKAATQRAFDGEVTSTQTIPVTPSDTLFLGMRGNSEFQSFPYRDEEYSIRRNDSGERKIFTDNIRLVVRSTRDSIGTMEVRKTAEGRSQEDARSRAEKIDYHSRFTGNELQLDGFLTTDLQNKLMGQEVQVTLYLPVGSTLHASRETYSFHRNEAWYNDILKNGDEEKMLRITDGGTECLDCRSEDPEDPWGDTEEANKEEEDPWTDGRRDSINEDSTTQREA